MGNMVLKDARVKITNNLAALELADFSRAFAQALPPLIELLLSPELRQHPRWGKYLPYDVAPYGDERSLGHAVRPDIVLTTDGPKVTEIDFVPSGRWPGLIGLSGQDEKEYLQTFVDWYRAMGVERVYYATGTVTNSKPGADYFAKAMQDLFDYDVTSVNIDEVQAPEGTFIDRLFYRSELRKPFDTTGLKVGTAEPWLDSKMVFALVHDRESTDMLATAMGADNLAFLRATLIPTYCLEDIKRGNCDVDLEVDVATKRQAWVLKSSRVEADYVWGSRSVVIGQNYSEAEWRSALNGNDVGDKTLGAYPIVQQFVASCDFKYIWDEVVRDRLPAYKGPDAFLNRATAPVIGRAGMPFLVARRGGVFVPPTGMLTLLQDDLLVHVTSKSLIVPFRIV